MEKGWFSEEQIIGMMKQPDAGMLVAATHRAPLRLAFPADVAERWFPNLYPANAGSRP